MQTTRLGRKDRPGKVVAAYLMSLMLATLACSLVSIPTEPPVNLEATVAAAEELLVRPVELGLVAPGLLVALAETHLAGGEEPARLLRALRVDGLQAFAAHGQVALGRDHVKASRSDQ